MTTLVEKKSPSKKKSASLKKNIDTLLASENKAKRLIGTLSLYGRLYYDWTLGSDIIEWRGPIQHLLGTKSNIMSGDQFLKKLTLEDFNARIKKIAECFKTRQSFEIEYHLPVGEGLYCPIIENAELLFTQNGTPAKILGSIIIPPQALALKPKDKGQKDKETGLLTDMELEKTLSAAILKAQRSKTFGAYICVSIDRLSNITAMAGKTGVSKVIKFISETLCTNVRDNDAVGRLAGNTFGLVLPDCDRWGIVSASERLLGAVQETQIKMGHKDFQLTMSSGGAIFPCETLSAAEIMKEADVALLDAQNTRGISRYWAPSIVKGGPETPPEPPKRQAKGKRRKVD